MKVIITGTTGMIGKAALLECLESSAITGVLSISRSPLGMDHPKLNELIISHFNELDQHKEVLSGYDACFHCMGVSVVGLSEEDYTAITFGLTKLLADLLFDLNPNMNFIYVSGAGTDSSEQGSSMWARVKGKTENYILQKGFKDAYAFRPGGILPEKGVKSRTPLYNTVYVIMRPFFPLFKRLNSIVTSSQIGQAMIQTSQAPYASKIIDPKDIHALAGANNSL